MPLRLAFFSLILLFSLVACQGSPPADTTPAPGPGLAVEVQASPSYVSFNGTSSATLDITADGAWTAATDQSWLKLDKAGGDGNATLTLTVDRTGVTPGHYAGSVLFRGAEPEAVVTVSMRFPSLKGEASDRQGHLTTNAATRDLGTLEAGVDYVPGELLVRLDSAMARALQQRSGLVPQNVELSQGALASVSASLATDYGLTVGAPVSTVLPLVVAKTDRPLAEVLAALERDGRVSYATPNYLQQAFGVPNDEAYIHQWHYAAVNLPGAWDLSEGTPDVTVAVIDGGFATSHPDLRANLLDGFDFGDMDAEENVTTDACAEHGTHVAGTVAAVSNNKFGVAGVAPKVRVLPLKVGVYDAGKGTCPMPMDAVMKAILYAAGYPIPGAGQLDEPIEVINMSLGGAPGSFMEAEVISLAVAQGVTVVAAAGNENEGIKYPAAYPGVIAVGATDLQNARAYYSNYGLELDLVAPGGDVTVDRNNDGYADGVLSTGWDVERNQPAYAFEQGTSMASPHVAGVAALLRSVNRDLNPAAVLAILQSTSKDLGASGWDPEYGSGLVDAQAAVALARSLLRAPADSLIVRLRRGGIMVAEGRADAAGLFGFENLAAGDYTLEVGTDVDGDGALGEGGELYGVVKVSVDYTGDATQNVVVAPR